MQGTENLSNNIGNKKMDQYLQHSEGKSSPTSIGIKMGKIKRFPDTQILKNFTYVPFIEKLLLNQNEELCYKGKDVECTKEGNHQGDSVKSHQSRLETVRRLPEICFQDKIDRVITVFNILRGNL